ncbi:MAG: histidine kinase [Chitinophagaceae bacterium]
MTVFQILVVVVVCSSLAFVIGLYLLANFKKLFRRYIKNELLRRNVAVWLIAVFIGISFCPTNPEFYGVIKSPKLATFIVLQIVGITFMALFIFNTTLLVSRIRPIRNLPFLKRMGVILFTIVACTMLTALPLNYMGNYFLGKKGTLSNIEFSLLFDFYTGCITGLIFITMQYVDLDRQRKMSEKELEVSRLQELKTKAELEALHSKINPHFLYNALNSIADLSITDGKKARKMTVALADLFRFSINYSDHNYSTIKEEVEMAEVYLQIEKIRFEDKLNYTVKVDEEASHYLVPRFVLQPIVENAVKHGLKVTGQMTEIILEVKKEKDGLLLNVADNGPLFPEELNPGYGVRSIFDKMDLLFPNAYEMHFTNQPRKQVSVHIKKLIKNEPGL